MTNPIVVVNASVQTAPTPPSLQQMGAFISQGGTTLAPGSYQQLTQISDLTAVLASAAALSSLTWTGGTVTATAASALPYADGTELWLTIAGAAPANYNGTFLCTVTGASTFTYEIASNPGTESTAGTYAPVSIAELQQMADTFFGMGSQQSAYVLELGAGSPAQGVTALGDFIDAQPNQVFYSYLVPRAWAAEPTFLSFANEFTSPSSKTYFWTTVNLQNYLDWVTATPPKSVLTLVEAPDYGAWPANALTAISWSGGILTATTTTDHGVTPGQWFQIAGCTPAGYNGWYLALEGTTGETLIAGLATNPGIETALGTLAASIAASNGVGDDEFSLASAFWYPLTWNPSGSNRVALLSFAFLYGTTPFPLIGNSSLLATLLGDNVNYVGTGAEGGISTSILRNGRTMDGNQFNYWYAIDWMQINGDQTLAAAIINGANNLINPLFYDQQGITTLQAALGDLCATGIASNLLLGSLTLTELDPTTFAQNLDNGVYDGMVVVNAVPFATYVAANPSNYQQGVYGGFSVAFTPLNGFQQIVVNMQAVQFASAA